ncbi:ParB N-terminal domain-containing protein [Burkholderia multivorans]|uniref:ParB/RepB/Spo0J family partition protein n=1 Tax=Burkholderia multivorans TaxID=87883 RepID=UPI001C216114|nr:ParB N-terminal domain-containing protein [Burkholderia multivorans]MBU9371843.1 ParB N-terminal domain-containing protein [Burkholderia multivorans]MBU9439355.1 ParB N-terminal domain-containing protein [Burkholderia multivorans]MBU9680580.1 ParB N-terminal domain-containing protein [Burkholderia multivorans]MCA8318295.1 ParB N-terminal domain-containing protein [Burkholderia multivorans]MCA8486752.1 ParB N-terminal domain-containing protein [Burkholderia multivorans]
MQQATSGKFASISALTRAASAASRAAEIEQATGAVTRFIAVNKVRIKPQVRDDFADVQAFAERLRAIGHVHTPILVRAISDSDEYELIAGERRIRGSLLNDWPEIQAKIFPAGTSDLAIRMYQVSENIDRKQLSVRETAIGLATDVELYGREQAASIWAAPSGKERSASWVSKHLRFLRYGPTTRALFDEDMFDDVEAANKMADIEACSAATAHEIATDMRAGKKFGRLTLDARLNLLKQVATPTVKDAVDETAAMARSSAPAEAAGSTASHSIGDGQQPSPGRVFEGQAAHGAEHDADVPNMADARRAPSPAASPEGLRQVPKAKRLHAAAADPSETSVWRVEEIYEIGTGSVERIRRLHADLSAAGVRAEDIEWRLWVCFVDLAASALAGMPTETAGKIINMFNDEINSSGPLELLNRLHPCRRPGVLPDDFGYDTDREIHPLAPNDWSL